MMIPSMSSEFDCFETCAWSMNESPWNKEKDKIGQLPINRTNLTRTQEGVSRHNERFFVNAWTISVLPERFT